LISSRPSPKAKFYTILLVSVLCSAACVVGGQPRLQAILHVGPGPFLATGPSCPLSSAPSLTPAGGLWHLGQTEDPVLPYDLVLAGYPEQSLGKHPIVTKVTLTAYSSTIAQCDSTPWETATLKRPRRGYVALSRDLIATYTPGAPFRYGDKVEIVGLGIFQVEDTMNPRWQRRADVWMPSTDEAIQFGRQTVLLARLGDRTTGTKRDQVDVADLWNPNGESTRSNDL